MEETDREDATPAAVPMEYRYRADRRLALRREVTADIESRGPPWLGAAETPLDETSSPNWETAAAVPGHTGQLGREPAPWTSGWRRRRRRRVIAAVTGITFRHRHHDPIKENQRPENPPGENLRRDIIAWGKALLKVMGLSVLAIVGDARAAHLTGQCQRRFAYFDDLHRH